MSIRLADGRLESSFETPDDTVPKGSFRAWGAMHTTVEERREAARELLDKMFGDEMPFLFKKNEDQNP